MSYYQTGATFEILEWDGTNQAAVETAMGLSRYRYTLTYDVLTEEWGSTNIALDSWVDPDDTLFIPRQNDIYVIPLGFYVVYRVITEGIPDNAPVSFQGISATDLAAQYTEIS